LADHRLDGLPLSVRRRPGGLGWALAAGATAVVLLDGDGQHRPDAITSLTAPVLAGEADVVVGSRFIGRDGRRRIPGWRVLGQRALNAATTVGSGQRLTDSQSGFRALSRRAALVLRDELRSDGFAVESEMQLLAREYGLRTLETPIVVDYDVPLKRNPVAHALEVLNGFLRLAGQARPLLFFSVPGLVALLPGLLLGLAVVSSYDQTGQFAVGHGLLTVLLVLAGLLALFSGVLLHTMRALFLDFSQRHHPPRE
jgi:glycosyltransferase involved in cell wall biosynthesis